SQTLATQSYNATTKLSTVQLWDVASGQLKATLKDAYGPVFSADSKTLATGGNDNMRLWDVASGQLKATLKDARGPLVFATDGKTLATRDATGKLLLWDVALARPMAITAQTSLAQFPPWVAHPFSWSDQTSPEVSLLDPFDEHVL